MPYDRWELFLIYLLKPSPETRKLLAENLERTEAAIEIVQRQIETGHVLGFSKGNTNRIQLQLEDIYKLFPRDEYMFSAPRSVDPLTKPAKNACWYCGEPAGVINWKCSRCGDLACSACIEGGAGLSWTCPDCIELMG